MSPLVRAVTEASGTLRLKQTLLLTHDVAMPAKVGVAVWIVVRIWFYSFKRVCVALSAFRWVYVGLWVSSAVEIKALFGAGCRNGN